MPGIARNVGNVTAVLIETLLVTVVNVRTQGLLLGANKDRRVGVRPRRQQLG